MPATFENVRLAALSMDNAGLRHSLRTCASDLCLANEKKRWHTCCATRGAKPTRVGKSRYSPFTSSHRFFYRSNFRAVLIACLFKIAQFLKSLGSRRRSIAPGTKREKLIPSWNWTHKCSGKGHGSRSLSSLRVAPRAGCEKLFTEATLSWGQSSYVGRVKSQGC